MKSYVNMSDYSVNERNKRALDDLVWRVMENEDGRPFDLVDFLAEQKDLAEMAAQALQTSIGNMFYTHIESRLRKKLEDSEAVEVRAAEMAGEE